MTHDRDVLEWVCILGHANCSYKENGPCVRRVREKEESLREIIAAEEWEKADWDKLGENPS